MFIFTMFMVISIASSLCINDNFNLLLYSMIRMDSLVVVTQFEMNAVAGMRIPFVSEL